MSKVQRCCNVIISDIILSAKAAVPFVFAILFYVNFTWLVSENIAGSAAALLIACAASAIGVVMLSPLYFMAVVFSGMLVSAVRCSAKEA